MIYMNTFLYTNTLYSLALIVNTNIGSVVNDEVVVMGIILEYHRSNDGGNYAKILLLLEIERKSETRNNQPPRGRELPTTHTTILHSTIFVVVDDEAFVEDDSTIFVDDEAFVDDSTIFVDDEAFEDSTIFVDDAAAFDDAFVATPGKR